MPVALITGAARANGIAAGIAPHLASDGWEVVTSDRDGGDSACDLSTSGGPQKRGQPRRDLRRARRWTD